MQKFMLVAIGGALGSIARYGLGSIIGSRMGTRFPFGTFAINLIACFALGFAIVSLGERTDLSEGWTFLIPIGFIGAFSTFSTFEWETFSSLKAGSYFSTVLYVALSFLLGLTAVWLGVSLARRMV